MDDKDKSHLKMLGAMLLVMGLGGFFIVFMLGLAINLIKLIFP